MFRQPDRSPWGEVRDCDTLCPGVFMVMTPGHGGILVSQDISAFLSPAARKQGMRSNGYLCYEEDTAEVIVLRELLDKKLWGVPHWIDNPAAFEEHINKTLREHHPDYWRSRTHGRDSAEAARPAPVKDVAQVAR